MKPVSKSSTVAVFTFLGLVVPALLLSGCAGNINFPDTVVPGTAQQTSVGAIQGSVYGGHAPLTQSHVYMLQPNTSSYGGQATSIISSTASNAVLGNDPGLPSNSYYVLTDGSGQFNLTGDYTCTPNVPVYLYAYAGYPDFPQSSGVNTDNTFNVQSVSVSGTGPYYYTFTFATQSFNFQGQRVYFSQNYGPFNAGSVYNSTNAYIVYSAPAPGQITIQSNSNTTGSTSGLQLTFAIPYNTDIVNLAVLGICPSTGSLKAGGTIFNGTTSAPLNYIYMNEVSTVAAAYAFAPFSANANLSGGAFSSATNYASYIGTSSTNLVGLQNAALNAGQLYSVNGTGPISTVFEGEGHVANATTPTGNGIINQVTIDTVGNILASCVDSWSGSVGTSTQCATLFQYATNTGIPTSDTGFNPGTPPNDTATAAINIALHPTGPPPSDTNTTLSAWVAALYNLPTGAVPFTPNLTAQPHDFTVGILYTAASNLAPQATSYLNGVGGTPAVDKIGEVWFRSEPTSSSGWVFQMSPQGVINTSAAYWNSSYQPGSPVIDSGEDIWYQPQNRGVQSPTLYITPTSLSGNPYTYSASISTATPSAKGEFYQTTLAYPGDSNGHLYFIDPAVDPNGSSASTSGWDVSYFPNIYGDYGDFAISTSLFVNSNNEIDYAAADSYGYGFLDQGDQSTTGGTISRVGMGIGAGVTPTTGTWPVTPSTSGCSNLANPQGIGVLRASATGSGGSEDAIVVNYGNDNGTSVMYIGGSTGNCTELKNSSLGTGFNAPLRVAVDGRDYVYVTNNGSTTSTSEDGSITVLNAQAGTATGTVAVNVTESPQYQPSGTLTSMLYEPLGLAIDPSGNIWVTNNASGTRGNSIVEIIGAAAPTSTPLSAATCINNVTTTGCIGYPP